MSGISEERLAQLEEWSGECKDTELAGSSRALSECIAEIRRLRAENKELRASYERVDRALRTVSGLHPARDQ